METVAKNSIDTKYIDVLDGIRAVSVILVMVFHFWQQTWIFPRIPTPFLGFLGISAVDLTSLARVGYLFVDMMVLLSGFLLFLPLMRHIFLGETLVSWKSYARKRVARIVPSYCFAVFVSFFLFALPAGEYKSAGQALRDLVTHLSFTQTLFMDTYFQTKCVGVLWTVAVEVFTFSFL